MENMHHIRVRECSQSQEHGLKAFFQLLWQMQNRLLSEEWNLSEVKAQIQPGIVEFLKKKRAAFWMSYMGMWAVTVT